MSRKSNGWSSDRNVVLYQLKELEAKSRASEDLYLAALCIEY